MGLSTEDVNITTDDFSFSTELKDSSLSSIQMSPADERVDFLCQLLSDEEKRSCFDTVFSGKSGYEISLEARKSQGLEADQSFTYGDVSFEAMKTILEGLDLAKNSEFLDCGSGIGKALVSAALFGSFKRVVGVELLSGLACESKEICMKFEAAMKASYSAVSCPEVTVIEDNFLNYNVSSADVVLMTSTCFSRDLMGKTTQLLNDCKSGVTVISVTQQLNMDGWDLMDQGIRDMNWGAPMVFVYKKLR